MADQDAQTQPESTPAPLPSDEWRRVRHPTWRPVAELSEVELVEQAEQTLVRVQQLRDAIGTLAYEELADNLARGFECDRELLNRRRPPAAGETK